MNNYLTFLLSLPLAIAGCSCAQKARRDVAPVVPPAPATVDLRYPERVAIYQLGRQVEPSNDGLMHEAHPVYRLESDPAWNLHPGPGVVRTPGQSYADPASSPLPLQDDLRAELNRQRAETTRVMNEAGRLAEAYGELQKALAAIAESPLVTLAPRLLQMEQRLERLESHSENPGRE
ncbi:MAG: hypothetical protein JNK85_25705 [Verrucomicrobiales bacterium]|nr:hypothetical protein [Verrucomicrobiales bacterium]